MAYKPRYDSGDWKAICDVCGREFKASQLQQRWDGLMCCSDDWEVRHPQDFVRGVQDVMRTPWSRPESQDNFIQINYDRYGSDVIECADTSHWVLTKYINPLFVTDYVLDGFVLNAHSLNATYKYQPNDSENINLAETINIFTGFGRTATDTLTLTESIRAFVPSKEVLNGRALNIGAINL